ncbi:hypothetical protein SSP35_03_01860 [Streptomyces sp. NBRC 110611]|uniref:DUF6344 domain-containing protein n=1 Tax=Streptomyces sp. NBRC 110611 TaxID=1621259 RepID=UPI00082A6036|nr:DUF6344 domain-containing protein [Streptomyces sp. NBRC 110611]GAU66538.1 hypothetical protein SSP35_03_01860 [Streptomyces sp. NBRC 110611]
MAATKVMKFWATCLALLGKLLAALGVSAPASAARREAALYERTLGDGNTGTGTPGDEVPEAARRVEPEPDRDPDAGTPAVSAARAVPRIPAPRSVPLYGQSWPVGWTFARPELPPTIKQRISAEAHGASPGLRSRRIRGIEPLSTAGGGTKRHSGTYADARAAIIPAARRHAHTARTI